MNVRKATSDDIERILEIYTCAKAQMKHNGNPHQWNGFQKCGIIYVEDGTPRIAYHKVCGC